MKDQDAFREDPRGSQEVAEQQPETQPGEGSERARPSDDEKGHRGETGRDDGGETGGDDGGAATGNPSNAG